MYTLVRPFLDLCLLRARPQDLPLVVVPGGEHFFHGRLHILARIVQRHCA